MEIKANKRVKPQSKKISSGFFSGMGRPFFHLGIGGRFKTLGNRTKWLRKQLLRGNCEKHAHQLA